MSSDGHLNGVVGIVVHIALHVDILRPHQIEGNLVHDDSGGHIGIAALPSGDDILHNGDVPVVNVGIGDHVYQDARGHTHFIGHHHEQQGILDGIPVIGGQHILGPLIEQPVEHHLAGILVLGDIVGHGVGAGAQAHLRQILHIVGGGNDAAGSGVMLEVIEHLVHLIKGALGIGGHLGNLVAIGLANGSISHIPRVPDMGAQLGDDTGFLLINPQNLLEGGLPVDAAQGHDGELFSQVIHVAESKYLLGMGRGAVLPDRAHIHTLIGEGAIQDSLAIFYKNTISAGHSNLNPFFLPFHGKIRELMANISLFKRCNTSLYRELRRTAIEKDVKLVMDRMLELTCDVVIESFVGYDVDGAMEAGGIGGKLGNLIQMAKKAIKALLDKIRNGIRAVMNFLRKKLKADRDSNVTKRTAFAIDIMHDIMNLLKQMPSVDSFVRRSNRDNAIDDLADIRAKMNNEVETVKRVANGTITFANVDAERRTHMSLSSAYKKVNDWDRIIQKMSNNLAFGAYGSSDTSADRRENMFENQEYMRIEKDHVQEMTNVVKEMQRIVGLASTASSVVFNMITNDSEPAPKSDDDDE